MSSIIKSIDLYHNCNKLRSFNYWKKNHPGNMKKWAVILSVLISFSAQAQKIKFLNATEQHWVGGECCSYGVNYLIYLESTDTVSFIHIDTAWIGDKLFTEKQKNNLANFKNVRKGKTTFRITMSSSWSNDINKGEEIRDQKPPVDPPKYKGKACLIYYTGKQRNIISVKNFIKLSSVVFQ
jgi:hypothetical protein